jgi:hypothetical protein
MRGVSRGTLWGIHQQILTAVLTAEHHRYCCSTSTDSTQMIRTRKILGDDRGVGPRRPFPEG